MLDHIGIEVSNYQRTVEFYRQALAPLGYELLIEIQGYAGFGRKDVGGPIAELWMHEGNTPTKMHLAFKAKNRQAVDAFYEAAVKAGGKDNGKPGVREMYHPTYYGAFVLDFDGNNVEAVCHTEE